MSKALLQNGITQAEYNRVVWALSPEAGATPADLLDPKYYAHIAKQLKTGARLEATAADGSWFMELYVRSATGNSAVVAQLSLIYFDNKQPLPDAPAKSDAKDPYVIKHRGPRGWSVVRTADKAAVFEDGKTQAEAENWLAANALA